MPFSSQYLIHNSKFQNFIFTAKSFYHTNNYPDFFPAIQLLIKNTGSQFQKFHSRTYKKTVMRSIQIVKQMRFILLHSRWTATAFTCTAWYWRTCRCRPSRSLSYWRPFIRNPVTGARGKNSLFTSLTGRPCKISSFRVRSFYNFFLVFVDH